MVKEMTKFQKKNTYLTACGIDEPTWNALCSTIYPGASQDSIMMAVEYCVARKLDIMLKPVHLVPMSVKNPITGNKEWRDVVMPGIGLYRIQADRSGTYAGADEPEFGPSVIMEGCDSYQNPFKITYPEWCKYTVHKMIGGIIVKFVAKEYWLENYAVQKSGNIAPNAMWKKRPFAQLAKCSEAQALRKAWPEIGSEPTMDEMEGSPLNSPDVSEAEVSQVVEHYPQDMFDKNFPLWEKNIIDGVKSAQETIDYLSSKTLLTEQQIKKIQSVGVSKNEDS